MKILTTSSLDRFQQQLNGVLAANLVFISWVSATLTVHASDAINGDPWNIMVVPSRQTVFSGDARQLFNKNCASCHSKDGRAQTPIARQRHVQDLSECRLEDAAIIEQILEGTRNKANTFKMRAFKDRLTRAEIESLVPLVKAFRPVPPSPSDPSPGGDQSANPRLVGIINLTSFEYAVFEKVRSSGRYFMLREKESHAGVTLDKIKSKQGMVRITVGLTNPVVSLTLDGQASSAKRTGKSGWLKNLDDALTSDPHGLVLNGANTDLVLFLVSQFTGQTLIRSPRLPIATFDLKVVVRGPGDAAHRLQEALRAKGIATLEIGEKFLLLLPESEARAFETRSHLSSSLTPAPNRADFFPGGAIINLTAADLSQMVKLYADLTGCELDRTQQLPALNGTVNFTTQTPLTTAEGVFALETMLALRDLKIIPVSSDFFKLGAVSDPRQ